MVGSNFTECGARYMSSPHLISRWNYTGPTRLIPNNPLTQITTEGCVALCGTAPDWYPWTTASNTITTWIMPIIGTLLQAPFESNAFWRTVKASCRWLGSPMSSLASVLWNIEVSSKCALFVDMAAPYDGPFPDESSDFASMRDSFYILMNINQYRMKPLISMTKEAEGLLRIALFSRDLRLIGTKKTLRVMRQRLAQQLRSNRRKGVVPVFISTLWFLFSLGISIQAAFGELGNNAQAHDLAMGLFMSWFPILVLCSIIDRNPVASDDIQRKLNKLIDATCDSLQDFDIREDFIATFQGLPDAPRLAQWIRKISGQAQYIKGDYFHGFAGQGRVRFHYGAAHAILVELEKCYVADHGRNWLANASEARTALMLGQVDRGLVWFDGRQFWQFFAAIFIVIGTGAGAFILSYFTPTVGLACRSGGFMVFGIVSFALLLVELGIWMYTSPIRKNQVKTLVQQRISMSSQLGMVKTVTFPGLATTKTMLAKALDVTERVVIAVAVMIAATTPWSRESRNLRTRYEAAVHRYFDSLRDLTLRQWLEVCIIQPMEVLNTIWLCYVLIAQTFGAYVTCACQTSIWAGGGGYLDFTQWTFTDAPEAGKFWILGTVITCVVMAVSMFYLVQEWCFQAHLSTEDYVDAMRGLQRVRRFRRCTFWVRYPATALVHCFNRVFRLLGVRKSHERKALVWTKESRYKPSITRAMLQLSETMHATPFTRHKTDENNAEVQKPQLFTRTNDGMQQERPHSTGDYASIQSPADATNPEWSSECQKGSLKAESEIV